jgi:glucose-1-phosphate adenylyltransferase
MDYNKILEYHIEKKADITVVCKEVGNNVNVERFGCVKTDMDGRITEFEEKPVKANSNTISCGIYIIRRRQLVEMIEKAAQENRYDFVNDILIRYKGMKKIYGWMLEDYWSNISTVESYYKTNMDFLKSEVQDFFFREQPTIYSKAADLPPAKFNVGSNVKNSLIGSGCIINSNVEGSVIFKRVFIGNNSTVKNSIILNGAYVGDNVHVENCIVESNETLLSDQNYIGENEIKVVFERQNRYGV